MAKTGRWLRSLLGGKKDRDREEEEEKKKQQAPPSKSPAPNAATKEKRRWSFRRSTNTSKMKELNSMVPSEFEVDQKRHAMAVAAATKAAADAAVAAAQAAAVVIRLTAAAKCRLHGVEEAAAVKIQAIFRSYLARKALRALKGLVKLQALIRGQLVRRFLTVHARDRMLMAEEAELMMMVSHRQSIQRRSPSPVHPRSRRVYEMDRKSDKENIKTIEIDRSGLTWSSMAQRVDNNNTFYPYYYHQQHHHHHHHRISPAPSSLNNTSLMARSGHFDESSFKTAESSPYYYSPISSTSDSIKENMHLVSSGYASYPNYMANTESSKAKVRSQSTPRQRPASPRRRPSMGSALDGCQSPWKENYYKFQVPYEVS